MNPDKPHAFRVRTITDTRIPVVLGVKHTPHNRDEECPDGRRHRVGTDPTGDRTCNVCGGSETLLVHDVEAARFRRKYLNKQGSFGMSMPESAKMAHGWGGTRRS